MEQYTVILKAYEPGEDDSELEGYYFPLQNVTFALEPRSGIFSFHIGKPEVIDCSGPAWSCCRGNQLKAFAELYGLFQSTGKLPVDGEYFSQEIKGANHGK